MEKIKKIRVLFVFLCVFDGLKETSTLKKKKKERKKRKSLSQKLKTNL